MTFCETLVNELHFGTVPANYGIVNWTPLNKPNIPQASYLKAVQSYKDISDTINLFDQERERCILSSFTQK